MAEQDDVREMFTRLGGKMKEAGKAHIKDEIRGGFTELPPITSGVAKLTRLEFYKDEGILRFRAIGTVEAPMYGEGGVPVKGLETSQFAAFTEVDYDKATSDTFDVFRKLVGQSTLDVLYGQFESSPDYLLRIATAILAANAKQPIYFRFSNKLEENKSGKIDVKTGKPYPPRTWQRWQMAIPGYTPLAVAHSGTTVPTSANGSANGHTSTASGRSTVGKNPDNPAPWSERQSTPTTTATSAVEEDWDQVVADATLDNDDAKGLLEGAALELGYTKADVKGADDWAEVGEWVKSGVKKGEQPTTLTMPPRKGEAVVGNTVKFFPQDKKYPKDPTKRNSRGVDCEILDFVGDDQMTIQSLTDNSKTWVVGVSDPYVTYPKKES